MKLPTLKLSFIPDNAKKVIARRLLVTFVWLVVVTLVRWQWQWNLVGFWLGGVVGTFFLDIDHLIFVLVAHPLDPPGPEVKKMVLNKQFWPAIELLAATQEKRIRLSFHNAPFQAAIFVLCFFVLTSTNNLFGAGLVMGMALDLLRKEFSCLFQGKDRQLITWLFWPLGNQLSFRFQKFFVYLMLLIFLGLSLFLI